MRSRAQRVLNLKTTVDALLSVSGRQKCGAFYQPPSIYTETEMQARYDAALDSYSKTLNIEALTMSKWCVITCSGCQAVIWRSLPQRWEPSVRW